MSSDSGGLMSSAGLVRYFDAEDSNTIRIDPRTIVAFGPAVRGPGSGPAAPATSRRPDPVRQ